MCFYTYSHSLQEDGQGPPKSERLSILTPFPNQALSEVLEVPSELTSCEHTFGKTYRGPAGHPLLESAKETPNSVKTDKTPYSIIKLGQLCETLKLRCYVLNCLHCNYK